MNNSKNKQKEKANVLIAEDDRFLRKTLKDKVKSSGYEVITTTNGEEAWNKIEENDIDLMLLDIMMPKLDGFDVLEKLKEDPHNLKVLVLSNLSQPSDKKKAKKLGADDYLVKSDYSLDEVLDRIKKLKNNYD